MSRLKPLYVVCDYVADNIEIPVTIMYSEVQTFETDTLFNKIAERLDSDIDRYFQKRGERND